MYNSYYPIGKKWNGGGRGEGGCSQQITQNWLPSNLFKGVTGLLFHKWFTIPPIYKVKVL